LDDALNWVPARITGILLVPATAIRFLSLKRARDAAAILLRDGSQHPSPNSGKAEAAVAGALGVQLGGTNFYDGTPVVRPTIGTAQHPLTPSRIREIVALMWLTSLLAVGVLCGVTWNH
jgi:adenosylcobinamide-phosphate synthase